MKAFGGAGPLLVLDVEVMVEFVVAMSVKDREQPAKLSMF